MTDTVEVSYATLQTAKSRWDQASDELAPAWRRLATTSTGSLSSRVASALEAFRQPWVTELKNAASEATANSEAITIVGVQLQTTDAAAAQRVRSLLPYVVHAAPVREL